MYGTVWDRYGAGTVEGNTTPSTALMTAKKRRDVINFSILLIFKALPGIRTRTIAPRAFPHTLRIHTYSSKFLHVYLAFESPIEYCGQLYVANCV